MLTVVNVDGYSQLIYIVKLVKFSFFSAIGCFFSPVNKDYHKSR